MPTAPNPNGLRKMHAALAKSREEVQAVIGKDSDGMWEVIRDNPLLSSVCAAVVASIAADITGQLLSKDSTNLEISTRMIAWSELFGKNEQAVLNSITEILSDD